MTAQLVDALKETLIEEKEMYKELLSICMQKKDILIQNDVAELNAAVRRETEVLRRLKPLSRYRAAIAEGFSKEAGSAKPLTLSEAIALLSGEERLELQALKEEFVRIVTDLRRANEQNRRLIETHLEYTAFCLNVLTQGAETPGTYENTGRVNDGVVIRRGLLDQKI